MNDPTKNENNEDIAAVSPETQRLIEELLKKKNAPPAIVPSEDSGPPPAKPVSVKPTSRLVPALRSKSKPLGIQPEPEGEHIIVIPRLNALSARRAIDEVVNEASALRNKIRTWLDSKTDEVSKKYEAADIPEGHSDHPVFKAAYDMLDALMRELPKLYAVHPNHTQAVRALLKAGRAVEALEGCRRESVDKEVSKPKYQEIKTFCDSFPASLGSYQLLYGATIEPAKSRSDLAKG